jgi:hypothetical protein
MSNRADQVSAIATGIGIGFLAFMTIWLIGARVAELIWDEETGAVVAMGVALLTLIVTSVVASRRLLRTVRVEAENA